MSFETLKTELNELKCAFNNPRIYIANYCETLRNRIDLAMTEKAINVAKDGISTDKIRQSHDVMTDQIRSFENECQNQLSDNKIRDINSDSSILEEIIEIEKKIEDSNHNEEDREQINDILLQIESCLFDIDEKIFIKKGFLFLTSSNLEILNWKERMEFFSTNEETNSLNKSKNLLVAVNNLFVSTRVFDKILLGESIRYFNRDNLMDNLLIQELKLRLMEKNVDDTADDDMKVEIELKIEDFKELILEILNDYFI